MKELIQPTLKLEADMPWWLTDQSPRADTPTAAVHPQLAVLDDPEVTATPLIESYMPQQTFVPPSALLDESPAQSWESIPGSLAKRPDHETDREPVAEEPRTPEIETEESTSKPAPRFSGLRNLLSIWGRKKLGKSEEPEPQVAAFESQPNPSAADPASAPLPMPEFVPVPVTPFGQNADSASQAPATAHPEIDFPKPVDERYLEEMRSHDADRDRRSSFGQVQILPSRRGQYKR